MRLPEPDEDAKTHSKKVSNYIKAACLAKNNLLSFAEYMQLALYTPHLGYYTAGKQPLGVQGDFMTAPEISPLFSYCLAEQCAEILACLSEPCLFEFGPGSGIMASHLLMQLEKLHCLPQHYYLLEISPTLREQQQQRIKTHCPHLYALCHWLDTFPHEPINGIILANEVLDAIPTHVFKIKNQQILECLVSYQKGYFQWKELPCTDQKLLQAVTNLQVTIGAFPEDYTSEINLALASWIKNLTALLKQGVVLLIDYGFSQREYYLPQRYMGTLRCYYQHHVHFDPFFYPGLQDITAHVDFSMCKKASEAAGLGPLGFTTQANFLLDCGLINAAEQHPVGSIQQQLQLSQEIQTLLYPSAMGEAVKAFAAGKGWQRPLLGFSTHDQLYSL